MGLASSFGTLLLGFALLRSGACLLEFGLQGPAGAAPGSGPAATAGPRTPALPDRLKSIQGEVVELIYRPRRGGRNAMVDVRLRCRRQEVVVRIAPLDYLDRMNFPIGAGDTLAVKGYPLTTTEGKLLAATEVSKAGRTLRLRKSPGRPVWKK